MKNIKRILIWLRRFRHRCGYGVHSPFAFDFITNVIYEKTPYYAYRDIEWKVKNNTEWKEIKEENTPARVNRLLFRLVNRVQPSVIIDAGKSVKTSLYLQMARKKARYTQVTSSRGWEPLPDQECLFLHVNCPDDPQFIKELLSAGIQCAGKQSAFAIQGIYDSPSMKTLWKQVIADERVGITFDLYDLGILFFDKSKIKQHYTVNF